MVGVEESAGGHQHHVAPQPTGKGGPVGGRYTLDLRSKVLRVNLIQGWTLDRLREELRKFGAAEQIQVHWLVEQGQPSAETALVRFQERWAAEQIFHHRGELPFYAEWYMEGDERVAPSDAPEMPASMV